MENMQRYMLEIYRQGSLSMAARKLFITQPALSIALKKIEDRLGCRIFEKNTHPVKVTAVGKRYIESLIRIEKIEKDFENFSRNLSDLKSGRLVLGATGFTAGYILPDLISCFKESYEGIEIAVVEGRTVRMLSDMGRAGVDVVITAQPADEKEYISRPVYADHILLAVHKKLVEDSPVSALALNSSDILKQRHLYTPPLSLDRIPAGIPYIAIEDRTDKAYRNWYDTSYFANRKLEVSSMTTAYRLAKHGLGACLVSDMLVRQGQCDDMLFFRTDINPFERQFCAVYSRNGYLSRAAGAFISMRKI